MGWQRISGTLVGVAIMAGLVAYVNRPDLYGWGKDGISEIVTTTTDQPPAYALHILFIGNSFTFVHNVPRQFADIASSDHGSQTQYVVQSVTRGGITLAELWNDGKATKIITDGPAPGQHWDYIVLQEMSSWAMAQEFIHNTHEYAKAFDALAKQVQARTLIELTWVNKPGDASYSTPEYSYTGSPDNMYKHFVMHTNELAEDLGATVVPVGTYWQYTLSKEPGIDLYESDGHHQSVAGAYLAALVFYKTISSRDVSKITFAPGGIMPGDADKLRHIVAGQ